MTGLTWRVRGLSNLVYDPYIVTPFIPTINHLLSSHDHPSRAQGCEVIGGRRVFEEVEPKGGLVTLQSPLSR